MKTVFSILLLAITLTVAAQTNVLELTWLQPPGWSSTLYSSTNLSGVWTPISTNTPPTAVQCTQSTAFFFVSVAPQTQFSGPADPLLIVAVSGSTFVNTNNGDFWINVAGGTNGWVFEIQGL